MVLYCLGTICLVPGKLTMTEDNLLTLAEDPRHISGIYNYCDRWCERCPFTSRCLLYAMEQKDSADPASRDPDNAAFWQQLHSIFDQTKQLIQKLAQ